MSTVASGVSAVKSAVSARTKPSLDAKLAAVNHQRVVAGWKPIKSPKEIERFKRWRVYADGSFNRRLERLLALLLKARTALEELSEVDEHHEITSEWEKAGLPEETGDEVEGDNTLEIASWLRQDAAGAAWALSAFIQQLDSNISGGSRRRRGGRGR